VKELKWSAEKSAWLKRERGLSFEEITELGVLIRIDVNPGRSDQKIMLLDINRYIWVIPFEEQENAWFLKTAYPCRKYTRAYEKNQL